MPNTTCDLHLHTYYSDGKASPAEVLYHAEQIGLKTVAITDHDTLDGLPEATNVAQRLGLELIPGVELTTRWEGCPTLIDGDPFVEDVDLLGYFFRTSDPAFQEFVQSEMADLHERISACCEQLTANGYPVTIFNALDVNPRYPGAMQVIEALHRKGYAGSWNEAYPLFAEAWTGVRPPGIRIEEAIQAIHTAGGVAVLAHPIAIHCQGGLLEVEQLRPLVEAGLDGLEVYHPRLTAEARQHFSKAAQELGLVVSGGSDEHGWRSGFSRMGSEMVGVEVVKGLRGRAEGTMRASSIRRKGA